MHPSPSPCTVERTGAPGRGTYVCCPQAMPYLRYHCSSSPPAEGRQRMRADPPPMIGGESAPASPTALSGRHHRSRREGAARSPFSHAHVYTLFTPTPLPGSQWPAPAVTPVRHPKSGGADSRGQPSLGPAAIRRALSRRGLLLGLPWPQGSGPGTPLTSCLHWAGTEEKDVPGALLGPTASRRALAGHGAFWGGCFSTAGRHLLTRRPCPSHRRRQGLLVDRVTPRHYHLR